MKWRRLAGALSMALLGPLAGCGGGGGFDSPQEPRTLAIDPVDLVIVKGRTNLVQTRTLRIGGLRDGERIFIQTSTAGGTAVVADIGFPIRLVENIVPIDLSFRPDLAPGRYADTVTLTVCEDSGCNRAYPGSPLQLPIALLVTDNLVLPARIDLRRSGNEAAPSLDLPLEAPAEVGSLTVDAYGGVEQVEGITAMVEGSTLKLRTSQRRAGVYQITLRLKSPTHPDFSGETTVRYEVLAPPGGERELAIEPLTPATLSVPVGSVATYRFRVLRPSWTSASVELAPNPFGCPQFTLTALGGDEYEARFDGRGVLALSYSCNWIFSVADGGGLVGTSMLVLATDVFEVPQPLEVRLGPASQAEALRRSSPVLMADGSAVAWTAVSLQPWLRVLRPQGITGVDALEIEVDRAALAQLAPNAEAQLSIAVDRAGVPARNVPVRVNVGIPVLRSAATGALRGASGRLLIHGAFPADALLNSTLRLEGATLRAAQLTPSVPAVFEGTPRMLVVDVDGAIAGQALRLSFDSPLVSSAISVPVLAAALAPPAAWLALPYDRYLPPSHSSRLGSLHFAGTGRVWKLAPSGAGWALGDAVVAELFDLTLGADEATIEVATPAQLLRLDAATLGVLSARSFRPGSFGGEARLLAPLLGTRDGALYASWQAPIGPGGPILGSLTQWSDPVARAEDAFLEPFNNILVLLGPPPPRLPQARVSAARRAFALSFGDTGQVLTTYDADLRAFVVGGVSTTAGPVQAVADDGTRTLHADGAVLDRGVQRRSIAGSIPADAVVGGYGLLGSGRHALAYVYRLQGSGDSATAGDAQLLVIDLESGTEPAPVIHTIALAAPLGCGVPRAAGEECRHSAHIVVDGAGLGAYLVGPRAVAVVPLPAGLATGQRARPQPGRSGR